MDYVTVDTLRARYGCKTDLELSILLGMTPGNISVWRKEGVPEKYQNIYRAEDKRPEPLQTKTPAVT